ncbi:MarR family winged helix-turn-helix transcriptional regulator [Ferrimonas balearica]|uniref:MarR family winged helix-turn-helix transcriptional regulator n=1 Tax=Ferrimonas balearica TaxID=44012 RepID=UPI001C9A040A|nr:MarR family transcriptional regulator [Ferrimonas balearica]MBY5921738.1 MarR family transcriptional regulator [Ferrimonas balearica]MBY5994922.1 MarR family transcriptional regulator [Ferrimonas balearica]
MRIDQSLMALERYITRRWREVGDPSGLSLSYTEYDYLQTLEEAACLRLSDLAEMMRVAKPSASTMCQRLERKGLVSRKRCDADARAVLLQLTEAGQTMLAQDRDLYRQLLDERLGRLDDQEQRALANLLARMVERD